MALKINFTKDAIRDLVCPEGKSEIYVYDTNIKGLALRVTKAGGKTFYVVRKVNGKDQRRKIDVFDYRILNRPWFPRHSPSSENSVSHTLLATAA